MFPAVRQKTLPGDLRLLRMNGPPHQCFSHIFLLILYTTSQSHLADLAAKQLARQLGTRIVMADTIYALLDEIKTAVADVLPPIVRRTDLGRVRILKVFKQQGTQQVVGGKVEEGIIKKGAGAEIQRSGDLAGKGAILQVQREKTPVSQVSKDAECGILIDSASTVRQGDIVIAFEEETVRRTL